VGEEIAVSEVELDKFEAEMKEAHDAFRKNLHEAKELYTGIGQLKDIPFWFTCGALSELLLNEWIAHKLVTNFLMDEPRNEQDFVAHLTKITQTAFKEFTEGNWEKAQATVAEFYDEEDTEEPEP
jgi:hypothetical protein